MAAPTEAELTARVTERLRRDHPDPKMRAQLYASDKLPGYVAELTRDCDDEAMIARVVAGVRAAEDGQPA
ncbi:MAG TPA: hypothetical protein VGC42_10315 [Kofleriaceae bacterium]